MSFQIKIMQNFIISILTCIFLCSCTGIDPKSLKASSTSDFIFLREPVTWIHTDKNLRFSSSYRLNLESGKYIATYEDDAGRFYRGHSGCLALKLIEEKNTPLELSRETHEIDCAIYVPFDESSPARAFIFLQTFRKRDVLAHNKNSLSSTQFGAGAGATQAVLSTPATPLAAGLGAGIGTGVVNGIIAAEAGRLAEYSWNDSAGIPRSKFLINRVIE